MVDIETISGRGRSPRASAFINRKPASNLIHAVLLAEKLGTPLNQFVTFNIEHTACPRALASQQFEKLRDNHFGPWLRRNTGQRLPKPPAYVWAIENANGHLNIHWLVHVPKGRVQDFRARLSAWLAAVTGEVKCASAIHVRHASRPAGAGKYILKGIDPAYAPFFRITPVPQGVVHGKRSGFSRSLGPTVRRRMRDAGALPQSRRFRAWPTPAGPNATRAQPSTA